FESLSSNAQNKQISLKSDVESMQVIADKRRIYQVLNNLLSNAIKFSPNDKPVTVSAQRKDDKIIVSVADCGPGIAATEKALLFEKFFQVGGEKAREGYGLGLA